MDPDLETEVVVFSIAESLTDQVFAPMPDPDQFEFNFGEGDGS